MEFAGDILRQCWFLAGPTAVGKSAAGLELAALLNAEIVSLDSMTLYRGMDIGTAKPSLAERQAVRHHLIDILDPHEEYSLAQYLVAAEQVCRAILARGRTPLFVGGTGLYLRTVLRGLFEGPEADWEFRRSLEGLASQDPQALHARLQAVDPESAARLHPHDTRRLIRALEVQHLTGVPLSVQQQQQARPANERPAHVLWLEPPRDWLYERIDRRVEVMFENGLVAEVRALLGPGKSLSRTARQALGYKEVIEYLSGARSLAETVSLIQQRSRHFAKRQQTWYRNLEECEALSIGPDETAGEIARRLFERMK